jgi:hypothetical protein
MPAVERTDLVYRNMRSPSFMRAYYRMKTLSMIKGSEVEGSTPPDLFVGSYGYPNVFVGPLVPPQYGDTTELGTPESWVGKNIEDIVKFRSLLVRGMHRTKVYNADKGRIEGMLTELALSDKYLYADAKFSYSPIMRPVFDDVTQPFGPSAPIESLTISSAHADRDIEAAYSDTDATATDMIIELYKKGILVSRIQKALSAGVLGIGNKRKYVPTRWSITAVDDTLSKANLADVKQYDYIDSIRIYENDALDNHWIVLMLPMAWSYELIEAWYPKTAWNVAGEKVAIYSSHEYFNGRKDYAEIGGCYYAARLAVSEFLKKIGKQAAVVIMRETHEGYTMPVGVWNVREHVREALKSSPLVFDNMNEVVRHVDAKMRIHFPIWLQNSDVLTNIFKQRRLLFDYNFIAT